MLRAWREPYEASVSVEHDLTIMANFDHALYQLLQLGGGKR